MVITVRISNLTQTTSRRCGQRIGLVGKSQYICPENKIKIHFSSFIQVVDFKITFFLALKQLTQYLNSVN